jgi:hypothetical protein
MNLTNLNIIIIANNFNPTIFSETWLKKNNILDEKDIVTDYLFSPLSVSVLTTEFELGVFPDRLSLSLNLKDLESAKRQLNKVITGIFLELPNTPFVAFGYNFTWQVELKEKAQIEHQREFCLPSTNPLGKFFEDPSSRFGVYMSKNYKNFRLRLNIQPQRAGVGGLSSESMTFHYNFHNGVDSISDTKERAKIIVDSISIWKELYELTKTMTLEAKGSWL